MFSNNFKNALRHLKHNKVYAFIHIIGLSLGLAASMLIILYVKDEVSFDRFHKNVNRIFRIVSKSEERDNKIVMTGPLQGPRFIRNVPGIKSFLRLRNGKEEIKNGTYIQSQDLLYADSNFFSFFTFPLLSGNAATCLTQPHSIVLTEDIAIRQFGTTDALGKLILVKEDSAFVPCKVTGVAKRCPQNSSIQFEVVVPIKISDAEIKNDENWFGFSLNTFLVLEEKADLNTVEKEMQKFYLSDATQAFETILQKRGVRKIPKMSTYFLQPFTAMHLSTELPVNNNLGHLSKAPVRVSNGLTNAGNPVYAYILSGIALFVLLIACINFINLTLAQSVKRAKEIGVRKVIGGSRKRLIGQFLGESFLLCTVAFLMAVALVQLFLPLFGELANKALSFAYLFDTKLIIAYILLYFITGMLAGFYPAFVLSGYNPVQTLYSRFQVPGKNYLQKSLVVLQFTLASFLIIGTLIVYAQFNFLTKTDLGYDDRNLLITEVHDTKHAEARAFETELMKNPAITGVSAKNWGIMQATTKNSVDSGINFRYETVDENFLPLLKIPLISGRYFSSAFPADSAQSVIVNESFVKAMRWKNPIGELVNLDWGNIEKYFVVGVVRDYHFASLNEKIVPQLFVSKNSSSFGTYYIRVKPGSGASSLKWIHEVFQRFYPEDPFSYVFKEDQNRKQYAEIEKWKQIILFGAALTVFISCIGLFGLSVSSAQKRKKEIGVRKVFGATVTGIVLILSVDFIKLVGAACLIASPLAYLAATKWLQNFPYRISLNLWMFAAAFILVHFVGLFTIAFQSVKAARSNPVKSLRTE